MWYLVFMCAVIVEAIILWILSASFRYHFFHSRHTAHAVKIQERQEKDLFGWDDSGSIGRIPGNWIETGDEWIRIAA